MKSASLLVVVLWTATTTVTAFAPPLNSMTAGIATPTKTTTNLHAMDPASTLSQVALAGPKMVTITIASTAASVAPTTAVAMASPYSSPWFLTCVCYSLWTLLYEGAVRPHQGWFATLHVVTQKSNLCLSRRAYRLCKAMVCLSVGALASRWLRSQGSMAAALCLGAHFGGHLLAPVLLYKWRRFQSSLTLTVGLWGTLVTALAFFCQETAARVLAIPYVAWMTYVTLLRWRIVQDNNTVQEPPANGASSEDSTATTNTSSSSSVPNQLTLGTESGRA